MKTTFAILASLLIAPLFVVRAADRVAGATLRDPGFELLPTGPLAESWRTKQGWEIQVTGRSIIKPGLRAEGIADTNQAKSGTRCLALTIPADNLGFEFVSVGRRVQLAAGKGHEVGAWVRWPDGPDKAPADASATSGHRSAFFSFWAQHRDCNRDFAGRDEWLFDNQ